MLQLVAFLFLAQAAAADEAPVLKVDVKDVPAQGQGKPIILCEGTTNLPTGARLEGYLFYDRMDEGPVLARTNATVKDGKLAMEFQPYQKKNFPGKYVARLVYNPALQLQNFAGFRDTVVNLPFRFGDEADFQREAKVFRGQLAAELQAMVAMGEQVKTQIDKLEGKPAADWAPFIKEWQEKSHEIMVRADPHKTQEYYALNIDHPASTGLENLSGILISAAKYAAAGRGKEAIEGITVLRTVAENLIGEMNAPRLTTPGQVVDLIDAAKALTREALAKSGQPLLLLRRKFLEMNALLQKSMPEEVQGNVLEISTRAAAFFNALSDKEPNVKELQAELEKSLEKLAAPLRPPK